MTALKLSPSILSADFTALGEQVRLAEQAGADYIHVDVMDGAFVPNITMGPHIVEAVRRCTTLPLDVHLMIEDPRRFIGDFARAGASILTVHQEADRHLYRTLAGIRDLGLRAGLALNPATPLLAVEDLWDEIDLLLVMTVNPGFSGQRFLEGVVAKVARARRILDERGSRAELEVDGGVKVDNAAHLAAAGADVLVAGSAVFSREGDIQANIRAIKRAAASGRNERVGQRVRRAV